MIEEVMRAGAEMGQVNHPSLYWNGQADFVLFVALAAQRQESQSFIQSILQQRTGKSVERRGLIETAVSCAQHPLNARYLDGDSQSRAAGRLVNQAGKARE